MGDVVCWCSFAVGSRVDLLAAPAHRSGVSCAGGGVCADVCPDWLEVELCGDGTPHDRTRNGRAVAPRPPHKGNHLERSERKRR